MKCSSKACPYPAISKGGRCIQHVNDTFAKSSGQLKSAMGKLSR